MNYQFGLHPLQTGRKPSGICGAALYISALSHGCSYSKSEIVSDIVLPFLNISLPDLTKHSYILTGAHLSDNITNDN